MMRKTLSFVLAAMVTLPSHAAGLYENVEVDAPSWTEKLESRGFLAEYGGRRSGVNTLDVHIQENSIHANFLRSPLRRSADAVIIHSEQFISQGRDISITDARDGMIYGEVGPVQASFIMSKNAARRDACTLTKPCHLNVSTLDGPPEPITYYLASSPVRTGMRALPRQVHVTLKRKRKEYLVSFHPYIQGMVLEIQTMRGENTLNSIAAIRQYLEQ